MILNCCIKDCSECNVNAFVHFWRHCCNCFAFFEFPQPGLVDMMACEAARKVDAIFCQMTAALRSQSRSLGARVGQLESELKAVMKNLENATAWRENVLSGCPILFEESGLVFILKLFGKLEKNPDKVTTAELTAVPLVQNGRDHGRCPSKSTTKHCSR